MEREQIKAIVENLLLAADEPVTVDRLYQTLTNGTDKSELRAVLEELQEDYRDRSLQIVRVAEGYQLSTRHEYSEWIRKFLKLDKTTKLTQPSLDTLSIIAYKQPITRTEVEEVRGVDASGVIRSLLEKKIISPAGRKKVPGRPIMYRTTRKFLEYFGLKDLSDLPVLEDLKEADILGDPESPVQTEISFEDRAPAPPNGDGVEEAGQDSAPEPSDGASDAPAEPEDAA